MRSLFTALAFLVMLLAVLPAVKRSLYPLPPEHTGPEQLPEAGSTPDVP